MTDLEKFCQVLDDLGIPYEKNHDTSWGPTPWNVTLRTQFPDTSDWLAIEFNQDQSYACIT